MVLALRFFFFVGALWLSTAMTQKIIECFTRFGSVTLALASSLDSSLKSRLIGSLGGAFVSLLT